MAEEERKYFITFEGIDGCGKDTQLYRLADLIKEDNNGLYGNKYSNIWLTREPTKLTDSGKEISRLLKTDNIDADVATRYFIDDRKEHTKMIKGILGHSDVLCSRYDLSALTYQCVQGTDLNQLYELHSYGQEHGAMIPDVTLFFDLPAEEAARRTTKRSSDREFFENLDFQKRVREKSYEVIDYLMKRDNRKIIVINSDQSIDAVTGEMYEKLKNVL